MGTQLVSPDVGNGDFPSKDGMESHAILQQMERMLASPHFCHSKRYPVFLRYVIEETLAGRADELKERTVGVEVFQRAPNYDTNLDPIVRVTAGEVRKRIAQYYHDSANNDELRVDLPPGSYVPQFKPAADPFAGFSAIVDAAPFSIGSPSIHMPPAIASPGADATPTASYRRWIGWATAALAVSCILAATVLHRKQPSAETMWKPLLSANTPILISVGQHSLLPRAATPVDPAAKPVSVGDHSHVNFVVFSDLQALTRITTMLAGFKQPISIQSSSSTTYADLRQQPAVLMGGFNNTWTRRALLPLRFNFVRDDVNQINFIRDQRSPDTRQWAVDFSQAYTALTHDYAIVARFTDPTTHQVVFVVAGIGEDGTKAASEFATDPESMRSILDGASEKGSGQNFEAVIGTDVINGVSGPPQILAKEVW